MALRERLDQMHRTATLVRDQISHDAWRMLNALHIDRRWRQPQAAQPRLAAARAARRGHPLAERVQRHRSREHDPQLSRGASCRSAVASSGAPAVELTRELVWRPREPGERRQLRLLLELGDSYMTYRSRYLMTPLTAAGARPAAARRDQPARRRLPAAELDDHFAHCRARVRTAARAAPDPEAAHRRCGWPRSAMLGAGRQRRYARPGALLSRRRRRPARAVRHDRPQLFRPCGDAGRHAGHAARRRAVNYEVSHRTHTLQRAGLDLAPSAASACPARCP